MVRRYKRKKKRANIPARVAVVVVLVVLAVVVRWSVEIGDEPAVMGGNVVAKVIDGDTFILASGERVRLLAIDTPEKGERFYDEATVLLERLAEGKEAKLTYSGRKRDRYGRLLAYVWVDDTLLVNKVLIDSGLAYLYLFRDTDQGQEETSLMLAAQRSAMERSRGLWTVEHEPEPQYLAGANSYRFHRPVCSSVDQMNQSGIRTFATREEALAEGLSPCRRCRP